MLQLGQLRLRVIQRVMEGGCVSEQCRHWVSQCGGVNITVVKVAFCVVDTVYITLVTSTQAVVK